MNIHTRAYLIENKSAITILDRFTNPPPLRPCTARPAINIVILTVIALNALPIKKTAIAIRSTGLRPQISLTLPQTGVEALSARM